MVLKVLGYAGRFVLGVAFAGLLVLLLHRFVPATNGTVLMGLRSLQGQEVRHDWVPLEGISPHLVRAVIAAEDMKFCQHIGFDFGEIKAAIEEAKEGEPLRGASTISQQTSKNVFLWPGRGALRKLAEAGVTVPLETLYSKGRIMELYLNVAEWGDGLFGAEAAARARFGKPASDLTAREAALLATVLPNPKEWRVDPPGPYVRKRSSTVEQRMRIVAQKELAACVLKG